ncbi:MAG: cupin domain-containing protein [Planctomycetes bacterium]|nr:cupin domain-containing protein [Planctomycetota bacterium]
MTGDTRPTRTDNGRITALFSVDAEARKATMLIRMAAGTSYPRHRHAAREECFVLEGTLEVGASTLRAGDFQVAERDSIHDVQATDTGCLLLIVSSQDDELV